MTLGAPRRLSFPPWLAERILYHEDGLLVVDKPPGIPVHGGHDELRESVVERLVDYLSPDGSAYLGVHSRLDLGTSGVLLFTTAPERNGEVALAMEQGTLRRKYLGIVWRGPRSKLEGQGTIRVSLHYDGRRSRKDPRGKAAVTHYRVMGEFGERALVEFELETGRTHQIRASLVELGAALYGDSLYGGPAAPRLALHAHSLEGSPLPKLVRAPFPSELEQLLHDRAQTISLEEAKRRVRDAITFRVPLAIHTTALRWVDGEPDLLPGIVVEAWNERAILRAEPFVEADLLRGVRCALGELGFEIQEAGDVSPNRLPGAEDSRPSEDPQVAAGVAPDALEYGLTYPLNPSRPAFGLPLELKELRRRLLEGGEARSERGSADRGPADRGPANRGTASRGEVEARRSPEAHALNLFCGDGSLSRALAASGITTVNVDLSRAALHQTRRALGADSDSAHKFWQLDARNYLDRAHRDQLRFEYVVLDPPAKTTRSSPPLRIPFDYRALLERSLAVLKDGGSFIFVCRATGHARTGFRRTFSALAEELGYEVIASEELGAGYDFRSPPRATICLFRVCASGSRKDGRRPEFRRR